MDATWRPTGRAADHPSKLLLCHSCGRTSFFSEGELVSFIRAGWPACCGETMALFLETPTPTGPHEHAANELCAARA